MIFLFGSVNHSRSNIIMASSMVMFGNSMLESIALKYLQVALAQNFAFNDRITPWSMGCVTKVLFGGKTMRSIAINPGICRCTGQLSTINAILRLFTNFWSKKVCESIQLFVCALCIHSKDFTFLKHLGILAFLMRSSGNFSPAALAALIPVNLTLLCLLPVHFSPFNSRVLFGSAWRKILNSSALKISLTLYLVSW